MADTPDTELLGVYGAPITQFESNEDGDALDPATRSVGWALAWGCQLTFGMEGPGLTVTVSISDAEQKAGVCKREVTPEQLREYVRLLRELAHAHDQVHGRPRTWVEGDPEPGHDVKHVRDKQGDVWTRGTYGVWTTPDTVGAAWPYLVKKWAPLIEVRDVVTPRGRSGRRARL